ncbi:hypothetical protein BESB_023120 [Besnoitia besnoiti]|uniref:Uncharacterized protein n=1 Tax=Besnoitia besnoiti TaxID=94643 RepID=A0A2A9M8V5_BESBE|nr:hypothetical protein BESB_023120 [Besnoitia besnoiti]PFH31820.1 hypothetical protein BESB_023120 [Besnoitia besnoiti]
MRGSRACSPRLERRRNRLWQQTQANSTEPRNARERKRRGRALDLDLTAANAVRTALQAEKRRLRGRKTSGQTPADGNKMDESKTSRRSKASTRQRRRTPTSSLAKTAESEKRSQTIKLNRKKKTKTELPRDANPAAVFCKASLCGAFTRCQRHPT